jgi:hypothetical protein
MCCRNKIHCIYNKIREKLPAKSVFSDQDKTIWVLVKAYASNDGLLDEKGIEIVEVGVW